MLTIRMATDLDSSPGLGTPAKDCRAYRPNRLPLFPEQVVGSHASR